MGNAQPCCTAADVAKPPVEPQNLKMAAALGNIEEKEFASMSNAEFESYLKALGVSVGATVKLRRLHREQLAAAAPSAAEMGEDMGKLGLELAMLSVDELRKRACDSGINELVVNATEKAGKNALIALIVGQQGVAGAVQKAGGMPTAEGITSKITNALDADGDGQISLDELPDTPLTSSLFGYFDKDGDGKVTNAELMAGFTVLASMGLMYASREGVPDWLDKPLRAIPGVGSLLPPPAATK